MTYRLLPRFLMAVVTWAFAGITLASPSPLVAEVEGALRSGQTERLNEAWRQLGQSHGEVSEISFHKGLIQLKREQNEAALTLFSSIPVASPYYLPARNNMAALLASQSKFTEAKRTLEEAFKAHQALEVMHKNLDNLKMHIASKNYAASLQAMDPGRNSRLTLVVATQALMPGQQIPSVTQVTVTTTPQALPTTAIPLPAPSTPPTTRPAQAAKSGDADLTNAAELALKAWARAWERKDVPVYLAAYAPDYKPNDGKSHAQWVKDREAKILSKGQINLQISQIEATVVNKNHVKLRFRQNYQADRIKISSSKTIDMKMIDQRWLVTSELSAGGSQR